jgi:transposase
MAQKDKYSIRDLKKDFPNDDICFEHIFNTLHAKTCSCGGRYNRVKGRLKYQCSKCRFQIAPLVGTIFEKTSTPLTLWFHALFIFSNAKSGISSKEMERQLGVTYKTAWRILKLIRESLKQDGHYLQGDVEMDEGFFGGKGDAGKNNEMLSVVMHKKTKVIGAIQRKGDMRAKVVKDVSAKTIATFLDHNIHPIDTRLLTDGSNRYNQSAWGYNRQTVDHGNKEYVRGDVHVNNVESFWSHIKRSIKGTHKAISKKHFQSYLDAFVWHRNNRYNDRERFGALLGALLQS